MPKLTRGDREADGEDACVVAVEVRDAAGLLAPTADNPVTFRVTGSGRLVGVGNGDPSSHESDKGDTRRAFNGLRRAIVQATRDAGELRVEAAAPGLEPAALTVPCRAAVPRPAVE
jgi:beta-galactosidase